MKKIKLLISLIIILFTCSCEKDSLNDIVVKEKEEANIIPEEIIKEDISKEAKKSSPNKNVDEYKQNKIEETKVQTQVTIEEEKPIDNSVDDTSIDYPIHKGKIDCKEEKVCLDMSLPFQFKYKDLIANTFYLEVLSKSDQVLGYFIEYVFMENKYESLTDCQKDGTNLKNDLNDKITSYECTEDNTLKIVTSY